MFDLLITDARLVDDERILEGDLAVSEGRIAAIDPQLRGREARRVVDARGRLLLPGMIDDQVHFREPGMTHKADIASESRAAVAGGVTSYLEMPNTQPQTTDADALRDKHARAAGGSIANWGFYLGATNDNLEEIKRADPALACGVKVFMGASTGNMLVDDPRTLEGIFSATPLVVATHCEDTPTIEANMARARERWGEAIPAWAHPQIRSRDACLASSRLAVDLARRHGTRLHVLHLTTADELALFAAGPVREKRITVEACVHHLFFDDTWYATAGNRIKCNPAVKAPSDREALLDAVADDVIDIVATDHAPHTAKEKAKPYAEAPAGLPLVQHALLLMLEHWRAGRLQLEQIVRKTSAAPAERFGIRERGQLREGYWADLVLVDPDALTDVRRQRLFSRCGWSPFADLVFRSRIDMTLVNGRVVYEAGEFRDTTPARPLAFTLP